MNSLILSVLVVIVGTFHWVTGSYMRRGNIKTGFCAIWCIDAIFAVCGTVISFVVYRYTFMPFLTMRNMIFVILYLLMTALFVWLAPSGFTVFARKRDLSKEEVLAADYRLNDTFGMVRNCFLILLFLVPIVFGVVQDYAGLPQIAAWKEAEVCGGFCFVAFLILVPICLRQAMFWLGNLADASVTEEERLLKRYRLQLQYRQRNRIL